MFQYERVDVGRILFQIGRGAVRLTIVLLAFALVIFLSSFSLFRYIIGGFALLAFLYFIGEPKIDLGK